MNVLGLVANTHDSGVALVRSGQIACVYEEERFNRVKRTKVFPHLALAAAIEDYGLARGDIDAFVTPWDVRKLRAFVLKSVLKGLPSSLQLLHARASGTAQPDPRAQSLPTARTCAAFSRGIAADHQRRSP